MNFAPLKVLLAPREQFPKLVAETPPALLLALICLFGLENRLEWLFHNAVPLSWTSSLPILLVVSALGGVAVAALATWVAAAIFAFFARKLGGAISARQLVRVFAWSYLPLGFPLVALIALFAVLGREFLLEDRHALSKNHLALVAPVLLVLLISDAWVLVLMVAGLSTIGKLSIARAVLAYLAGGAAIVAVILLALWSTRFF